MKRVISIVILSLISYQFILAQTAAEKRSATEKKAAEERKRSYGGHKTPNELKVMRAPARTRQKPDTADHNQQNNESSSQVITPNKDQPQNNNKGAVNSPAVVQTTTSEGGSPSILSEDNGRGRDGSGNVQRSEPNIAGAKIPGDMNLYKRAPQEKNKNTGTPRIRKQAEQPAITSKDSQNEKVQSQQGHSKENAVTTPKSASQNKEKNKSKKERKRKGKDAGK